MTKTITKVEATPADEYPRVLLPNLEEIDAEHKADCDRQRDLEAKIAKANQEAAAHWEAHTKERTGLPEWAATPKKNTLSERVKRFAGIDVTEESNIDHLAEMHKLQAEIDDLKQALAIVRDDVKRSRGKAAIRAKEMIAAEYDALTLEMIALAKKVHRNAVAHFRLVTQLEQLQVGLLGKRYVYPRWLMFSPLDPYSQIAQYLRECVEAGHIAPSEIPVMIRGYDGVPDAMTRTKMF